MKDTKFIKGICKKTKQHFGLEIKKFGEDWKVVNFICISPEEASVITSEIKQARFLTNNNLQACAKCGGRKVSGCSCALKLFKCHAGEYNFQCIYCKNMEIDYSVPAFSGGYKEGEVIRLSQGQEVVIQNTDNRPLDNIVVGVGWDPVSQGDNMDVDSSVVLYSARGRSYDLVYYGEKQHASGCAKLLEDNLTGDYTGNVDSNDDENILVNLKKVPRDKDRLVFLINIYRCYDRRQTLNDVKNFYIRLYDPTSTKTLIEYRVKNNLVRPDDTAIVIGMASRKADGWTFKAIGRSLRVSDVSELADSAIDYI